MVRRLVPFAVLPLSLIACVLASTPWQRPFSSSLVSVPLYGAAVIGVLLPVVVVGIGVRRLWLTVLVDIAGFVFFAMLVALRELNGWSDLYSGMVHGPSQILSIALPLVGPRTLLVAPVALAWLCGATVGECLARGWQSVLPYATVMATFGLAYSGSARAIAGSPNGRRYDTLLAAALLLTLLLLRAAHSWLAQNEGTESTESLPVRGLATAAAVSLAIALVAAGLVQFNVFKGQPEAPARALPVQPSQPVDPIAFVSSLRPAKGSKAQQLFTISVDRRTSNFVAIAGADTYDGDTWSFGNRTFIPSGGVIPADEDPSVRPRDPSVTQIYTIDSGALTQSPWMPFQYRPQRVTGRSVDIDQATGMIVPTQPLTAGSRYTIQSATTRAPFDHLPPTSAPSTSAPASDTELAGKLRTDLLSVVEALQSETGVSSALTVQYLQAVVDDFRTNYRQSGRVGGTGFADTLASILGQRAGSPEQYATLVALMARQLGMPARIVTGFRIPISTDSTSLSAGTYAVTTADAWTWVEIPVQGLGWVALDPTPARFAGSTKPTTSGTPRSPSQPPTSSGEPLITSSSADASRGGTASRIPGTHSHTGLIVTLAVVGVLVLLLLVAAFLLLRKRLRARRRRRSGDPRVRLLGAWQESLDLLTESGLPELEALTSAEVAAAADRRFDHETGEQARFIGDRANAAIFSPTSWVGSEDADAAWRAHVVLRRGVRRNLNVRQRVGAGLRYHRPRSASGEGPTSWAAAAKAQAASTRRQRPRHGVRR